MRAEFLARAFLAPRIILAIEAGQRATAEKNRAGSARADDGRLLAKMRRIAKNLRLVSGAAKTGCAACAVNPALPRTENAAL